MGKIESKSGDSTQVSSQKLLFIANVLEQMEISSKEVFGRFFPTEINENQVNNAVTLEAVKEIYRNILAVNIPGIGLKIGQEISTKYYGLYGCTMLCRETLEDTLYYAIKYHYLTTRTTEMYVDVTDQGNHIFGCKDILAQPDLHQFNLELQVSIHMTLIRESLDDETLTPIKVYIEYPEPAHSELYQEFFGCPILFNQSFTGLEFTKEQFALKLPKHNPLAIPILMKSCDEELQVFLKENVLLQQVYNWISENIHNQLLSDDLADFLCITPRTLRRKLSSYNTSFSKICTEVKCKFAKQYCAETALSFDDIAISIGFSDTANFRRAFKLWTEQTPTEYRKQYQKTLNNTVLT